MVSIAPHQRDEHERRQQRPEHGPKLKSESPASPQRQPEPRGRGPPHPTRTRRRSRRPRSRPGIPITGPHRRIAPVARSTITMVTPRVTAAVTGPAAGATPSGTPRDQVEDQRHHRHRDQHDHRPRDGRRDDPPQQRQARRQHELKHRRDRHQRRQQRRPPLHQRRHRHRDERPRRAHQQDVSRPEASHAPGLDDGREAAHQHRGARRPRQKELALASRPHHDCDGQNHRPQGEQTVLQSQSDGDGPAGILVGLESNSGTGSAGGQRGLPFLWFVDQGILNLGETASLREDSDAWGSALSRHPRTRRVTRRRASPRVSRLGSSAHPRG